MIATVAVPGLRMRPVRVSARGDAAAALTVAGQARRTLAGQMPGGGFWTMPHGRAVILLCWRQNIERARRLRLDETVPVLARAGMSTRRALLGSERQVIGEEA